MRSRAARLLVGALAWFAFGAAAVFLFQSQNQIVAQTSALRAFDLHAREATDALADLRASEQAYVAEGQGVDFWTLRVASTIDSVGRGVADLRRSATSAPAQSALDEAASTLTQFAEIDKRARDYLNAGQQLMTADIVFTEGTEAAARAAHYVEAARIAEHEAFDAIEARIRQQQAMAAGGATLLAALVVLTLIPIPRTALARAEDAPAPSRENLIEVLPLRDVPPVGDEMRAPVPPVAAAGPALKTAADLATDFGRVRDLDELKRLLGRAADVMDANGLVVWMGNSAGVDLRPVLTHGYAPQVVARLTAVPRAADNAAAAAYRTGTLQIALSQPGGASGAVVAPILTSDGCIGALSVEIRAGGETSESVQALAAIVASHLAGVLAAAPVEPADTKSASG
jgi:hypothetical protein